MTKPHWLLTIPPADAVADLRAFAGGEQWQMESEGDEVVLEPGVQDPRIGHIAFRLRVTPAPGGCEVTLTHARPIISTGVAAFAGLTVGPIALLSLLAAPFVSPEALIGSAVLSLIGFAPGGMRLYYRHRLNGLIDTLTRRWADILQATPIESDKPYR